METICGDLAYHLMNVYKLDDFLYVTHHFPAFADVLDMRLNAISGLGHVASRSSLSDKSTDPKQKELIEKWKAELVRLTQKTNVYLLDVYDNRGTYSEFKSLVKDVDWKTERLEKIRAFNSAYIELEMAIARNQIKGTEPDFSDNFDMLKKGYDLLPASAKQYFASDFTFDGIKAEVLSRKKDSQAMKTASAKAKNSNDKDIRRTELLKMYKEAAAAGKYWTMPASKGNAAEASLKKYVEDKYPEWGKVVRVAEKSNLNVVRDKLGNIVYRWHSALVLCEDQGYKVVHNIDLHEDYKGGRYMNAVVRNDAWSDPIGLAK